MSDLLQRVLDERFLNTYAANKYTDEVFKITSVDNMSGYLYFRGADTTWWREGTITLYETLADTKKTSCPECGSTKLAEFTSLNHKLCTQHDEHVKVEWKLKDGQKPLL